MINNNVDEEEYDVEYESNDEQHKNNKDDEKDYEKENEENEEDDDEDDVEYESNNEKYKNDKHDDNEYEDEEEYDVEYESNNEYKGEYEDEESLCLKNLQQLKEEQIKKRRMYDDKLSECENIKYGKFISNYFPHNMLNHLKLLEGLMNYYKYEKSKNLSFFMSFQNFIDKFSKQKMINKINYKKQHVFEALCRLLLLFGYDNGELGIKKKFYNSLESIIKGNKIILNIKDILNENINVGNKAGKVDILFEIELNKLNNKMENKWDVR